MTAGPASPGTSLWTPHVATIETIVDETPGVRTYELAITDRQVGDSFRFAPGQFNMVYLPGFGESAISISSSSARPDRLSHTIRAVGNVTGALARMAAGESLALRGPFGSAWPLVELRGRDVVLACGGIGLAPLRGLIYHLIENRADYGDVHVLIGARSPGDLLYDREYDAWRAGGMDVATTVDRADPSWQGHIGVVTELLRSRKLAPRQTRVLTCGPEIMMRFVALAMLERGVEASDIYVSLERNMNCAVGMCGHCQLGPEFICLDGPVFSYARIEPYLWLGDL